MSYVGEIRKLVGKRAIFNPCAVGLVVDGNKVLLQKRVDNGEWAVHGGGFELGETSEEALKREIKEELGITVVNPKFFGEFSGEPLHFTYPNGDEVYVIDICYLITEYEGEINPDPEELQEVKWFDIDNLPEDIFYPDIEPLKALAKYMKENN